MKGEVEDESEDKSEYISGGSLDEMLLQSFRDKVGNFSLLAYQFNLEASSCQRTDLH